MASKKKKEVPSIFGLFDKKRNEEITQMSKGSSSTQKFLNKTLAPSSREQIASGVIRSSNPTTLSYGNNESYIAQRILAPMTNTTSRPKTSEELFNSLKEQNEKNIYEQQAKKEEELKRQVDKERQELGVFSDEEIKELKKSVLLNGKNYDKSIKSISEYKKPGETDLEAIQRIEKESAEYNQNSKTLKELNKIQSGKNSLGYLTKKTGAGMLRGTTGTAQAVLTENALGLKQGSENKTISNILSNINNLDLSRGVNNAATTALLNFIYKLTRKDGKSLGKKVVDYGLDMAEAPMAPINAYSQLEGMVLPKNSYKKVLELNDKVSEPSKKLDEKLNKESQKYGKATQIAGETLDVVGNMIPSMVATAVTKNPNVGLAAMGVGAKGSSTMEALRNGESLERATKIGSAKGEIEVGTEMLTGGLKMFGKGTLDDIGENLVGKATKKVAQKSSLKTAKIVNGVLNITKDLGGEIGEETISDVLDTVIDKNTYNPDAKYSFEDWKHTAGITAASTLVLNILTHGAAKRINKTNISDNNINTALADVEKQLNTQFTQEEKAMITDVVSEQINKDTKKVSLSEQLEKQGTKIIEQAIADENSMIENFKTYLEENNIQNPTQQDIDNSLIDLLEYDNEQTADEKVKTEQKYNQVIQEYLQEQNNTQNETSEYGNEKVNLHDLNSEKTQQQLSKLKQYFEINKEQLNQIKSQTKNNFIENKSVKLQPINKVMELFEGGGDRSFNEMRAVAEDIKEYGVTEPVYISNETNKIVDGTHRLFVAKQMNLDTIPVKYIDSSNDIDIKDNNWYDRLKKRVSDYENEGKERGIAQTDGTIQSERINENRSNEVVGKRRGYTENNRLYKKTENSNQRLSDETIYGKDSSLGESVEKENSSSSFSNETNQQEKAVKKVIAPLHEEIKALRKEISDIKAPIKEIEHQEKLYEDIENDDVIQARLIDDNVSKKSNKSNRQKTKPSKEVIAPLPKESSNNTTNENTTKETAKKLTRKEVRQQLLKEMDIDESAISSGKDISSMNYQLTDPIRVNEKVFGRELGKKINEVTVEQTKHNTAEKIRWLNQERTEIKELGIKPRSKESAAVQKYGEKQYVNKQGEVVPYGDKELMSEFPNVKTQEKIKKASEILRNKYDQYIDQINGTLEALGYDPIPKRKDYMRHFSELGDVFSQTGVPFNLNDMKAEDLPTDINGLTEFNKPGKNWFASSQKRYGVKTNYDAITGIDGYLEGASNLIFHTEDIQRYRALSTLIRETYGQTKGFEKLDGLTNEQIQQRIKDIQSNKLSKYVAWLDEQANNLAGKKGALDRGVERAIGRRAYTVLNTIKKQTGSNMTGFNVRSAMTNFISSTIASAKTNKIAMVKGTAATIRNMFHNDGFINKSDFLTSRFGSDMISSKMWQKASNAGQIFMTGSDYLTSNIITRSKYYEGLHKGMTETQAIKYADDFAARVMGDRSQGATAEAFNSKTLGVLTQFQLEVNNQWQYMLHDAKMDFQSIKAQNNGMKAGATIVFQMGQLAAFSYFFNELFEKVAGSRAAFDPIEIIKELFGTDDDDDKTLEQRTQSAISTLLEAVPFASLFTSGGRLPISEMLEPFSTTLKAVSGGTDKYGNKLGIKDIPKSVTETAGYYLLPTGYSQLKKTTQGLSMFNKDKEIKGSYTDTGKLRFPVKDTTTNRVKSALFGQWSSEEAREYMSKGLAPLNDSQTAAFKKLYKHGVSIQEYRDYKKKVSNIVKSTEEYSESKEKILDTIKNMDIPDEAKYILYDASYNKNNPFNIAEKVGIDVDEFLNYEAQTFKADKDKNGKSISGSKKEKIIKYINSMDIDMGQKAILYKLEYKNDDTYNTRIINYLNDLSLPYNEKKHILEKMDFKVKSNGKITWD